MRRFDALFFVKATKIQASEGLVVLLADLIKGLQENEIRTRIFISKRHKAELTAALRDNSVPEDNYDLLAYRVTPLVVSTYFDRKTKRFSFGKLRRLLLLVFSKSAEVLATVIARLSLATAVLLFITLSPLFVVGTLFGIFAVALRLLARSLESAIRFGRRQLSGIAMLRWMRGKMRGFLGRILDMAVDVEARRLARAVNRRSDVEAVFIPFAFIGELARALRHPKVLVFPDMVARKYPTRFLGQFSRTDRERMRVSVTSADAIVCYSRSVAEEQLRRYFPGESRGKTVIIIPQGFFKADRANEQSPRTRMQFKNHFGQYCDYIPDYRLNHINYVLYPSVDRPHKNMVTLIRAIEHLIRRRHLNIKLITTSHGISPDSADLIENKRLFLDCLFAPSLNEPDLKALVRHSRLVVHPSLAEGGDIFNFSRAVSLGVPALLADIPMAREMFDRYLVPESDYRQWLFEPKDYLRLAALIERSLAERNQLLQAQVAALMHLQRYDFAAMARRYYQVYSNLETKPGLSHV